MGVLFEPWKRMRIGVMYRSKVNLKLSGNIDVTGQGILWTRRGLQDTFGRTSIKLPHSINVSLYHEFIKRFSLLFDVGWEDWSSMKKTVITTETEETISLPRDWKDTWRIGLGLLYRPAKSWLLRSGISYDSSPIRGKCGLPDLPVDDQWRYAVGFDYNLDKNSILSLNYAFLNFGNASVDRIIKDSSKRFAGDYNQHIHLLSISFRHLFGS